MKHNWVGHARSGHRSRGRDDQRRIVVAGMALAGAVIVAVGMTLGRSGESNASSPPHVALEPRESGAMLHADGAADNPSHTGSECAANASFASTAGSLALVDEVLIAVRSGMCPVDDDEHRWCRSLFLVAITDPFVALGLGVAAEDLEMLIDHHRWALDEAVEAADNRSDTASGDAIRALARIDVADAFQVGPSALATAAIERGDIAIVEPIADAEQACLNQPR